MEWFWRRKRPACRVTIRLEHRWNGSGGGKPKYLAENGDCFNTQLQPIGFYKIGYINVITEYKTGDARVTYH